MDEVELKFLDINVEEIKAKLDIVGAELIYDSKMEMFPFLADGFHSYKSEYKYLRIRKVNDDVTITFKAPNKDSDMSFREEVEIKVDSYENGILLIENLGFERGAVFRKHRVHYEFGDVHFELDTLDNVPTYLEVETNSEEAMIDICLELGLDINDGKKGTIVEILPHLFNT